MNALPPHHRQLARLALATGLRRANVLDLQWSAVDLSRRTAWVHGDEAKGGEAIGVPLNDDTTAVLNEEKGKHPDRLSTYKVDPWVMRTRGRGARPQTSRTFAARLAACVGHVARHGRHHDCGVAGVRRVEVGADGEALRAFRARATAKRCDQAGHIFGHTWVRGERGSTLNVLIDLAPRPGLEPGTCGLTDPSQTHWSRSS